MSLNNERQKAAHHENWLLNLTRLFSSFQQVEQVLSYFYIA